MSFYSASPAENRIIEFEHPNYLVCASASAMHCKECLQHDNAIQCPTILYIENESHARMFVPLINSEQIIIIVMYAGTHLALAVLHNRRIYLNENPRQPHEQCTYKFVASHKFKP